MITLAAQKSGSSADSDAELVRLATSSGPAAQHAFRAIYDRFAPRLFGLCVKSTGDPAQARDLLQDIFLSAHRSLPRLRDPERLREWLFSIAMNALRAHAGLEKRRREILEQYEPELVEHLAGGEAGAFQHTQPLVRELRIQAVREVIAQLKDDRERTLLERYYAGADEPTTRELAKELGLPPSTVTVTLMRARGKVARKLVTALATLDGPG